MFQSAAIPDIAQLRRQVHALAPRSDGAPSPRLSLGPAEIDAILGGGLVRHALHEVAGPGAGFFAAALAGLAPGATAWISARSQASNIFPDGLRFSRLDTENALFISAPDREVFWAMEQALRSAATAVVVAEASGHADFTQSRRLQLAARETGTLALLLTPEGAGRRRAPASAAETRWRVAPRPAAGAPGYWLRLLKNKSGSLKAWEATWDAAAHRFRLAAPV